MLVTLLIPVTTILLGEFVLDELLVINHFNGMALICAGLATIDALWKRFNGGLGLVRHATFEASPSGIAGSDSSPSAQFSRLYLKPRWIVGLTMAK